MMQTETLFEKGAGRDLSKDPVLSYDPRWRTNADMIADLALLEWFDGTVLDLTYGLGGFWTKYRPADLTCNDINPDKGDISIDWAKPESIEPGRLWNTVVFDPPYKLQGTPSGVGADDRYGVDKSRTTAEISALHQLGCQTAKKLCNTDGMVIVKTQAQQANGVYNDLPRLVETAMADPVTGQGFSKQAHCYLAHTPPPQRSQTTPRNNLSHLLVFRKKG